MNQLKDWTDRQITNYYLGIGQSNYPQVFWDIMEPSMAGCTTLVDIGCGPGAFALKAAACGFSVQAVDIDEGRLKALQRQKKILGLNRIKIIRGDWLEVHTEKNDIAVCAYSFGGAIGTPAGIQKIIDHARRAAFFITPCRAIKTDFMSRELYQRSGVAPPAFSGGYEDLLKLFEDLRAKVEYEIVAYDFGMPLADLAEIDECAVYLADKLGLPSVALVRKHLRNIVTERNGGYWVPNPRESAIITWKRTW